MEDDEKIKELLAKFSDFSDNVTEEILGKKFLSILSINYSLIEFITTTVHPNVVDYDTMYRISLGINMLHTFMSGRYKDIEVLDLGDISDSDIKYKLGIVVKHLYDSLVIEGIIKDS